MNINELPIVSVIIPCFNHGKYIDEAIDSVFNQEYSNTEIIVIDDCSTDEATRTKLKNYNRPGVKVICLETNSGPSVARNIGIAQSKGKYILPLDGDDMLGENFLSEAVAILENSGSVSVVYGNGQQFGSSNDFLDVPKFDQFNFVTYNVLFVTAVIRKASILGVGGYDEYLSKLGLEDWDLWIGFGEKKFEFRKIEIVLLKIRILDSSRTFQVANKNLDTLIAYIRQKHANFIIETLLKYKMDYTNVLKSREYTLGNKLLKPLRWLMGKV